MRARIHTPVALLALATVLGGCAKETSFKHDVYPVLNKHCVACHTGDGEGLAKSGLDLSSYDRLMAGTKYGPVVVPGSSVSSTLVTLVSHQAHSSINMPKGKAPLSTREITVLSDWIDAGAKNN